ncbi:MAG: tetratricopeptide repeat protein [Chthoniobacterales bacterium]
MFARIVLLVIVGLFAFGCHRRQAQTAEKNPTAELSDAGGYIAQAHHYESRNDIEAAIRSLDAAIAKEPTNQEARRMRGDLYYKKNDLDKAMTDYAELRTETIGDWAAKRQQPVLRDNEAAEQMKLARGDEENGRMDDAFTRYTAILTSDISSAMASIACQSRGNLYARRGETEKAFADFQEAIRLNPRNAGAYANRGVLLAQKGDHEAAIKDFEEALQFEPDLFKAVYNRGLSYRDLGDVEKAQEDFARTIELNPDFAPVYVNRGALYARQKKFAQAAADYKTAQKLDPTLPEPLVGLAFLSLNDGKQAEAIDELEKALKIKSDSPPALNSLGWVRATSPVRSLRDGRKAVELALQACELSYWAEFQFVDTLAAAYAEAGDFAKAVEFQRFAMNLPSMGEEQRGDANKRLEKYLKREPYRDTTRP